MPRNCAAEADKMPLIAASSEPSVLFLNPTGVESPEAISCGSGIRRCGAGVRSS